MSHITVITPAYNCANEIRQTIISVAAQSYGDWDMVIVDDVSTDGTGDVCQQLAAQLGLSEKIAIVRRNEKFGETRNTYDICQQIGDDVIVLRLDGGDWLTDTDCFHIIDQAYEATSAELVWTAQRWAFTSHNISGPLDASISPYLQPWKSSHLKTFRRRAMNDINIKNYLDDSGDWIMIACDQAVFLPMLEKAWREKKPLVFLNMCMYHYNIDLEDSTLFQKPRSKRQKMSAEWIRARGYIE
jgi:glycosyltransferase involved in cell wall biosynthesis